MVFECFSSCYCFSDNIITKKISVKKILLFSIIIYLIGLLGESYFGLIKPLEQYPFIWTSLELVKMVIKTTRNGFFFGFIFVALGLYFSKTEHLLKMKHAAIGFSVSMIALFLEVSFVTLNNWRRDDDMYVSLLPVTFFLFSLALQVKLKDHKCWKSFRLTSSLVYYTHTMVIECVSLFLAVWKVNVIGTSWHFVLTAVVSILLSCLIIKLSSIEKLSWLKKIYI